jgi:hypothetical protein
MQKVWKLSIYVSLVVIATGCIKYKQNKGLVNPKSAETIIDFTLNRGIISFPANLDGVNKVFLFDTGDDLTSINRKEFKGRITKISNSTGGKTKTGNEIVKSMKIGTMEFQKICARNLNWDFIEKNVPNLGGTIGQSIIGKANWLIDYPNKKIKISEKEIQTNGFIPLEIKKIKDPFVNFTYEGETYSAFIDLGSSSELTVVEGSKLGKKLLEKIKFTDETRDIASASGYVTYQLKVGSASNIRVGALEFNNVNVVLRKSASADIRIGMPFFKNNMLYIDNTNKKYMVK